MAATLRNESADQGTLVRRAAYMAFVLGLLALVLLGRLGHLQLIRHDYYFLQSSGNQMQGRKVMPRRGIMLDRNGELLVANRAGFRLALVPEQVGDLKETLARLQEYGFVTSERRDELLEIVRHSHPFELVSVRTRLGHEQAAQFAVVRHEFPGVDIDGQLLREYPLGAAGAHGLGYVTGISAEDKARLDPEKYAGISHIGKTGMEGGYEENLRGTLGTERVLINAHGRPLSRVRELDPQPGADLLLAIDKELQSEAYAAMDSRRGAVVAIDPRTGGVRALVSSPAFDPNEFVSGMNRARAAALNGNPDLPMFNRAVRGIYPPGSTIKPMLALAALTAGHRQADESINCWGNFRLPGSTRLFRDWKRQGHGPMDLHAAIAQSCDVYFYQLARDMGIDEIHGGLTAFGFGALSGLDMGGEKVGIVPSAAWKRAAFSDPARQVWFPGETLITGIGQGSLIVTPLQLAQATAQIAMRGRRYKPRMVEAIRDPLTGDLRRLPPELTSALALEAVEHWDAVVDSMIAVMHGSQGTARATGAKIDFMAAGKTGTSQVVSMPQDDAEAPEEVEELHRDHSLFVAFAPVHDPVIALAVIVENAGSGAVAAAEVARRVLETYLAANAPPDPMAQAR